MRLQHIVLAILLSGAATTGFAQSSSTQPDNTAVNKRDRSASQPTADSQKNDKTDRMLTKNIRKSILADKSLSTDAHNIKIISQNGSVTLKGPVKSDEEKSNVMAKAVAVVGSADKVTNQISVKQ